MESKKLERLTERCLSEAAGQPAKVTVVMMEKIVGLILAGNSQPRWYA